VTQVVPLPFSRQAAFSPSKRARMYRRDGWRCRCCGETDIDRLTLDHIVPLSRGGRNNEENLQTLFKSCNSRKWNNLIPEYPPYIPSSTNRRSR
jgi:5-methylcytosine-specific restriction protein A